MRRKPPTDPDTGLPRRVSPGSLTEAEQYERPDDNTPVDIGGFDRYNEQRVHHGDRTRAAHLDRPSDVLHSADGRAHTEDRELAGTDNGRRTAAVSPAHRVIPATKRWDPEFTEQEDTFSAEWNAMS